MNRALTLALLLLALPASAETIDGNTIVIIDGDTVALPCSPRPCKSERVRLVDIDAPEMFRTRCEAESIAGFEAKERLAELLRGQKVEIERKGKDRYRRTLARLSVEGHDIGAMLMREGHAISWKPGRAAWEARLRHWCGDER